MILRLQQWVRPVLAGLVLLGLLMPTLDAFKCIDDFGPKGAIGNLVEQHKAVVSNDAPAQSLGWQEDADPLCPHGHCHHWVGVTSVAKLDFRQSARILELPHRDYDSLPSAPRMGLLRPPRA